MAEPSDPCSKLVKLNEAKDDNLQGEVGLGYSEDEPMDVDKNDDEQHCDTEQPIEKLGEIADRGTTDDTGENQVNPPIYEQPTTDCPSNHDNNNAVCTEEGFIIVKSDKNVPNSVFTSEDRKVDAIDLNVTTFVSVNNDEQEKNTDFDEKLQNPSTEIEPIKARETSVNIAVDQNEDQMTNASNSKSDDKSEAIRPGSLQQEQTTVSITDDKNEALRPGSLQQEQTAAPSSDDDKQKPDSTAVVISSNAKNLKKTGHINTGVKSMGEVNFSASPSKKQKVGETKIKVQSKEYYMNGNIADKLWDKTRHYFNKEGKFMDENDTPFIFDYSKNRDDNQSRYEKIGEMIDEYVYSLLKNKVGLKKWRFPKEADRKDGSFIFASTDALECDTLMILIHGSGVVRAGQWARRLIINHSLESGTQLPYIERAQRAGWGVLVMNTNDNHRDGKYIRGSRSPEDHAKTVWKSYVMEAKASKIVIVAHSAGGSVTTDLLYEFMQKFTENVIAIAFTDSVHSLGYSSNNERSYFEKVAQNWVSSSKPLGVEVSRSGDCRCVSAGTGKHEETSWKAIEDVFAFIEKRIDCTKKATEPLFEQPPCITQCAPDVPCGGDFQQEVQKPLLESAPSVTNPNAVQGKSSSSSSSEISASDTPPALETTPAGGPSGKRQWIPVLLWSKVSNAFRLVKSLFRCVVKRKYVIIGIITPLCLALSYKCYYKSAQIITYR